MPEVEIADGKLILRRSDDERKPLVQRLNRLEGQIRGIRSMIEEDRHCAEELIQIKAAMAALRSVALLIVEQHVSAGLAVRSETGNHELVSADLVRVIREALELAPSTPEAS